MIHSRSMAKAAPQPDPFAGVGGSYRLKPDGTRELVSRTKASGHGMDAPAAPEPTPDPEPES